MILSVMCPLCERTERRDEPYAFHGCCSMLTLAANRSLRPNGVAKYVEAYQDNAEIHPFAVNLFVSSFLLTLCNGLVATRAPEGGVVYMSRTMSSWRIQNTETQRWAGLDQDQNGSADGRYF